MKILKTMTILKVLVAAIASFAYFNHPHITRQIDTMGSSLMYAIKFQNGFELFDLLPTSLAIGDRIKEVTPMEFPFLNLLISPLFLLKFKYNYAFAHMSLILFNVMLFLWADHFLKNNQTDNTWSLAWWLTPLYGVEMFYFTRFMPDGTAFLLSSLSFMMLWFNKNRNLSVILGALALLMKPPLAIIYAIFLMKNRKHWRRLSLSLIAILIPAALYYTIGIEYLKSLSTTADFFSVSARNPLTSLIDFFSHPKQLTKLIFKEVFYRYSILVIMIGFYLNKKERPKLLKLFGVFTVQLFLAASLIAHHMYVHIYYIIGASFIVAWTMAITIKSHPKLKFICLSFIVITNLERSYYMLKPLGKNNLKKQCLQILDNIPELLQENKIRSTDSSSPMIGLCMQKVTNSKVAKYGVYPKNYKGDKDHTHCEEPIFETKDLKVCSYLKVEKS